MLRTLLKPFDLIFQWIAVRSAPRDRMHGFLVSCSSVYADCTAFFTKCRRALDLIRVFDPGRFRRLRRDVRVIALTSRGLSYYEPRMRVVFLDIDVLRREPEYVATTLVHEAVHARLHHARVRSYSRDPGRHERLCLAQEIAFASRLPNSEGLVSELRGAVDRPWWNDAGRVAQIGHFVRRHKLPRWVERFLVRFGARK